MNEPETNPTTTVTVDVEKPKANGDSQLIGVSVRGWIAAGLIGTFCLICIVDYIAVCWGGKEPSPILLTALVGQVGGALGFYFGQKNKT